MARQYIFIVAVLVLVQGPLALAQAPNKKMSPANSRSIIRNQAGNAVGVTPDFTICGTNPAVNFMAGEDPEEAEEITGLE